MRNIQKELYFCRKTLSWRSFRFNRKVVCHKRYNFASMKLQDKSAIFSPFEYVYKISYVMRDKKKGRKEEKSTRWKYALYWVFRNSVAHESTI